MDSHFDNRYSWLVAFVSCFANSLTFGMFNSFGSLYVAIINEYKVSGEQAAWVGSLSYSLTLFAGIITGPLSVYYGCRTVLFCGASLSVLGLLLSSFSNSVTILYLTYGVVFAFGCSGIYFSSILSLTYYFEKRLAFALAIAASGVGIGPVVFGPLCETLKGSIGLSNYFRVLALIYMLLLPASFIFNEVSFRGTPKSKERLQLIDVELLKSSLFLYWSGIFCLVLFAYYVPYVHLVKLAIDLNIPSQRSSLLLGYMSIGQSIGRLFFGRVVDMPSCNRLQLFQVVMLGMSVCNTLCPLSTSYITLTIYACSFGFFEGGFAGLLFMLTGDIFGKRKLHLAFGTLYCITSPFSIAGPPAAGYFYTINSSYDVPFFVAGACFALSSLALFLVPWLISQQKSNKSIIIYSISEKKCSENQHLKSIGEESIDSGIVDVKNSQKWDAEDFQEKELPDQPKVVNVVEATVQYDINLLQTPNLSYWKVRRVVTSIDDFYKSLASSIDIRSNICDNNNQYDSMTAV